jgi:ferrous iron transport protein A
MLRLPNMRKNGQLSEAKPGDRVTVVGVVEGPAGSRLEAVGFLAGTEVTVGRRAPLGDPTLYRLRGTQLSLRKSAAALVSVTSQSEGNDVELP